MRIGEFIEEVYQKKRIHSAFGYLTPVEFEEKWYRELETVASPSKNDRKTVQLSRSTTHRYEGEISASFENGLYALPIRAL